MTITAASTAYNTIKVDGLDVFYRYAGDASKPVVLLLHGYPTSSHMFRNLIPILAQSYFVVAPDMIGYGQSSFPSVDEFDYTFENLYKITLGFVKALDLKKFSIYTQDYGAPVGLRIAYRNPELIQTIITQNGNAYTEGFGGAWAPVFAFHKDRTKENEDKVRPLVTDLTKWQYTHGVDEEHLKLVSPDNWVLDQALLDRPGNEKAQLNLFYDYQFNVPLYAEFHKYFREHSPPLLAVWGEGDQFFIPPGAEAFKRDLPKAEVHIINGGAHFLLESHLEVVSQKILEFLKKNV